MSFCRIFAVALAAAVLIAAPARADRLLSGDEAHRLFAGQHFDFRCVDGTHGQASYSRSGVANASYRLPGAGDGAAVQRDQGRVRVEDGNVCIRWGTLNGGEESCFRVTERRPGTYRIAEGSMRWCDLSARGSRLAGD